VRIVLLENMVPGMNSSVEIAPMANINLSTQNQAAWIVHLVHIKVRPEALLV
jgi:hypothetical protein